MFISLIFIIAIAICLITQAFPVWIQNYHGFIGVFNAKQWTSKAIA